MNRLGKKCVIVSSSFHALLIGILLFGSALMPQPETAGPPLITFYTAAQVTDALSRGGNPDVKVAQAPPPQPDPVKPQPQPDPQPPTPQPDTKPVIPKPQPDPPKTHERKHDKTPDEETPDKPQVSDDKEKPVEHHKIVIDPDSLKIHNRKVSKDNTAAIEAAAQAQAQEKARRHAAQQVASAYRNLSQNFSSSQLVQMPSINGTSGEISANYGDIIVSKYYNAWVTPTELDDAPPIAIASVTISRDGNVINAHITHSSGNAAMDRSVNKVLQTVTFIEPFPDSSKDQQRTVTIKFNLQAKRGTG